jgi:flavodoxin
MPRTLVTYFSNTGNTKKIADAIYMTLAGNKAIKPVNELQEQEIEEYSLIFIGFPVYSHSIPFPLEGILRNIPPNKKIALFSTYGSLTGSRLSRQALEYAFVLASKAKILGSFSCRGKVSPQALEVLEKSPEHKVWAEMAVSASTHPDRNDLEDARSFARWILTLAAQN